VAVVGIGVDVVDVDRFARSVERTPGIVRRVLADGERSRSTASMAARFAAKEALAKALGAPTGLRWHDAVVRSQTDGQPSFEVTGTVADACRRRGATRIHLTLTHDAGVAVAMVVLES
jgi:holo-[acyl-carrier protein] synthase